MAASTRRSSRLATKLPEQESVPTAASTPSISSAASAATAATTAVASRNKRTPTKKAKTAASGQTNKDTKKPQKAATPSKAKTSRAKNTLAKPASKKRPADANATDTIRAKDASADNDVDVAKAKPTKRRRKSKVDNNSDDATATTNEAGSSCQKITVNPSDPCSVLPTEIWHKVLSHLPLSQVAKTSWVSKTWLDGARQWRVWQQICEKCKLGTPKLKYKTFMAIVCANSYFICDKCHLHSTGSGSYVRRSEIPLKVKVVVKEGRPRKESTTERKDDEVSAVSAGSVGLSEIKVWLETQAQGPGPGPVTDQTLGAQKEQGQDSVHIAGSSTQSQVQTSTAVQDQSMDQAAAQSFGQMQLGRDQTSTAEPTEVITRTQEGNVVEADTNKNKDAAKQTGADKDKAEGTHPDATQETNPRDSDKDQNQVQDESQGAKEDKGKGKAKEELDEEVTEDWNLCLECRQEYYEDHPETVDHEWQEMMGETRITKTNARERYHLSEMDLCGIPYEEYDNPHYRYGAPMCLYDIDDVEEEALRVHGGWVGIRAVGSETARKRRAAFKARQAAFNPRRVSKKAADMKKRKRLMKLIASGKIPTGFKLKAKTSQVTPQVTTTMPTAIVPAMTMLTATVPVATVPATAVPASQAV
ncbi:hypothetical protein BGZ68_010657 [Mortierella alpina]|nr:hypothetical protein BGZ68_010657 [Mortierella alpina]